MDKNSVIDILEAAIQVLSADDNLQNRYASQIMFFRHELKMAKANSFRLGVIGVTSSGKSTLINSLLGESVLPSRVKPSSCQLVRCHHSDEKKAVVYFEDGSKKLLQREQFTQRRISEYADESLNSGNTKGVKEIEIVSPDFPFDDDVLLIDSPGVDAFGYEGHEKLTMTSLLPTVDLCLLITICKSSSDAKLLDILNTIAETGPSEMPVIIVQNMMDSIQASPDGKKSRDEVARDHIRRLERIVNSSQIKDKSSVSIIQFSAIEALTGRIEKRKELLEYSNYFKLLDAIGDKLSVLKPVINYSRANRVRKELCEIVEKARRDSGSSIIVVNESFAYDSVLEDFDNSIQKSRNDNRNRLDSLDGIRKRVSETDLFSYQKLHSFLTEEKELESQFLETAISANTMLQKQCSMLNIDARDLYSPSVLGSVAIPSLHRTKSVERVKKKGFGAMISRILGKSSGYEFQTKFETDHEGTRKELLMYIDGCQKALSSFNSIWESRIMFFRQKMEEVVSLRRCEFEERKNSALVAQAYIDVADKLTELLTGLPEGLVLKDRVAGAKIKKPEDELFQIEVSKPFYAWYSLAVKIKKHIQESILKDRLGTDERILVIGGDVITEVFFLTQMVNVDITEDRICAGKNYISNGIFLCHGYTIPDDVIIQDYSSVFVLFSGTQIGSAEGPLFSISEGVKGRKDIKLFWVVQDFQEVINAKDVTGLLGELRHFANTEFPEMNVCFLLAHENPIYNLILSAIQEKNHLLQTDLVDIFHDLERFDYLEDDQSKKVIPAIINAFN